MNPVIPIGGRLAVGLGLSPAVLGGLVEKNSETRKPWLPPRKFFGLPAVGEVVRSHPGVLLDHLLPFRTGGGWSFDSQSKGPWLREFARLASQTFAAPDAPWRGWAVRHRELYPDGDESVIRRTIRPRWRWVIGLGNQAILETSITLHHTYGVPYVPGSALKGLTQALIMLNLEPQPLTARLQQYGRDRAITDLFGAQTEVGQNSDRAGQVVFVGAVPTEPPKLKVDVMTPHFSAYYQGRQNEPLEVEDPIPVPFLVVSGGAYDLTVTKRTPRVSNDLLVLAADLCVAALDEMGIGGKTAKGYGYFSAK